MTDPDTQRAIDALSEINTSLKGIAQSLATITAAMQAAIEIDQQQRRGGR